MIVGCIPGIVIIILMQGATNGRQVVDIVHKKRNFRPVIFQIVPIETGWIKSLRLLPCHWTNLPSDRCRIGFGKR